MTQYTQKINMSVGIVCMVNNTAIDELKNLSHITIHKSSVLDESTNISALISEDTHSASDKCGGSYKSGKKPVMVLTLTFNLSNSFQN